MPATHDDANLVMQIARWSVELGLPDALRFVLDDEFDPEEVSAGDSPVQKVLAFGEFVGTFVNQGVLPRDLVMHLWWMEGFWKRVAPAAQRQRDHFGEPRLWENFDKLVTGAS